MLIYYVLSILAQRLEWKKYIKCDVFLYSNPLIDTCIYKNLIKTQDLSF